MYQAVGRCVADMAFYTHLAEGCPIYWNPPGWGSWGDVAAIRARFGDLVPGIWKNALLVAMKPSSVIPLHVDARDYQTVRTHVVLTTNPGCWSFHDGTWQQLAVGSMYRMDETKEHASVNLGQTIRIHLVVDHET